MRFEAEPLKTEIEPLAVAHGVELVALEWLQGPGRGVLRLYIDRPGADPRTPPGERGEGTTANICAAVSRDVSAALDSLDLIEGAYDLEVSSPGFERPVQKREDFDRFKGLVVKVKTRVPVGGRGTFEGPIAGTVDTPDGRFAVHLTADDGKILEIAARDIARARIAEIKAPRPAKPGKGSRKQREGSTAPRDPTTTTSQAAEAQGATAGDDR